MSELVDRIALVLLRQYDQEHDASRLTAQDFHAPAREIADAIQPPPGGGFEAARITITRVLTEEGDDQHFVEATSGMSLVEALGLLRLAEDSLIQNPPTEQDDDAP